jgi:hypothetical protein
VVRISKSSGEPPSEGRASACSTTSVATATGSRPASRRRLRQVFIRIVNSQARRFDPRSKRPENRNALR